MKYILILPFLAFPLPSCGVAVDPVTGKPVVSIDAASAAALSQLVVDRMNEELQEEGK